MDDYTQLKNLIYILGCVKNFFSEKPSNSVDIDLKMHPT